MDDKYFEICIRHILEGDRDGLKEIYQAYAPAVYGAVLAVVKNRENAEDITSEFFIRLWQAAGKYQPGQGHKAWLFRIARNMTIDFMRKNQREQELEWPELIGTEKDSGSGTEQEVLDRLSFEEALGYLNAREKIIFHMKILGGCTFREIAEYLQIPQGTVSWSYQQGLEKLRRAEYGR